MATEKSKTKLPIKNNADYLKRYVDVIYLRAVVGNMVAFAEQTSFQETLSNDTITSSDYEDYGVTTRRAFMGKLKTLRNTLKNDEHDFQEDLKASDPLRFPLEKIAQEQHLSRMELDIIMTAYAISNTSRFERLGKIDTMRGCNCEEVRDFLLMLGHTPELRLKLKPHFGPGANIVQEGFISLQGYCETETDFLEQSVQISRRLVAQIQDITEPDDSILAFTQLIEPTEDMNLVVYDETKKQELLTIIRNRKRFATQRVKWGLDKLVNYGFGTTVLMSGKPGTGKTLLAHAVAHELKMKLLQVNVPTLFQQGRNEGSENFKLVMREAGLQDNAILFFDEADELFADRTYNPMMPIILKEFERFTGVCILATNQKQILDEALDRRILLKLDFELPDVTARKAIWQKHLPKTLPLAPDVNIDELAVKFAFSGGYIKNAVILACQRLATQNEEQQKLTQEDLINAARTQRTSQLERLTEQVIPTTKLENVILTPQQKNAIDDIIFEFRNKGKVFNEFNFKEIIPYGKATIALFHGPSGSGKTMCAEAICTELGLNLLNVSPASLISKYAGESSKNIAELFKKAKDEDAALLFDECEGLFAARSDGTLNPGLERDNNQQTATLLRAIERFDGLVILTSNFVVGNNMDKAFARRIRHHVYFQAPNEDLRTDIWKKHFPKEAPLDDSVDFQELAHDYEFSGGTIKQIALKAAFRAVRENSKITQDILRDLCDFEIGNNRVGYIKKNDPIGFAAL